MTVHASSRPCAVTRQRRPATPGPRSRLAGLALAIAAAAPVQGAPGHPEAPSATGQHLTVAQDNLWNIAGRLPRPAGVSRQQMMVAIFRANPSAFEGSNIHRLRRGVKLQLPEAGAAAREDRAAAIGLVEAHRAASPKSPAIAPPMVAAAAEAASAPPATATAPSPASAASEAQRAASAPDAPPANAAVPQPGPVANQPRPASDTAPSQDPGSAGRWIGAAVALALLGGAVWAWQRRPTPADPPESSTFVDEEGVVRRRRPRLTEVSPAAAEVAHAVEGLQATHSLVRRDAPDAPASAPTVRQEARLRLELVRALLAHGRTRQAQDHLDSLLRDDDLPPDVLAQAQALSRPAV